MNRSEQTRLARWRFRLLLQAAAGGRVARTCRHWHLAALDIRPIHIHARTPHLNGNVERSNRVNDQECYQFLDRDGITDDIHLFNAKLREW